MKERAIKIENFRQYIFLLLFACLAFWPLVTHIFSLKNDALSYFLPFRYQLSEAIRNGYFPFWSPYLYTGLPIHEDMQSGVWNPVVLIISLFTRYDMNVLQWETVFYIICGGIGFYKLCRFFGFQQSISLLLACSYMDAGFIIDSGSFIPWVTSAAWLPFMFLYFLRLMQVPTASEAIKLALSASLLFLAGYPSFFIVAFYIVFFIAVFQLIFYFRKKEKQKAFRFINELLITALLMLILCSPAIISYLDFLPYYSRGHGASLESAQINPFTWKNTISYFFPAASYKISFGNDLSARNAFIGLVPVLFLLYSLFKKWNRTQFVIALISLICFLFSLGKATPVREAFYHALPLMNSFRHPSTIRLFTGMGLLLLAGFGMHEMFTTDDRKRMNKILALVSLIVFVVVCHGLFFSDGREQLRQFFSLPHKAEASKNFLDHSDFSFWLVVSAILELIFLVLMFTVRKKRAWLILGVTNLLLLGWTCLPFTMISRHSASEVNSFIHSFPQAFPLSVAQQNVQNNINDSSSLTVFGYRDFYAKQISIQDHVVTPTVNNLYGDMLRDTSLRQEISLHRFAYCSRGNLVLTSLGPNSFSFAYSSPDSTELHVTQQYHHNWRAFIDRSPQPIDHDHIAFMKLQLPKGKHSIRLVYKPIAVILTTVVSLLVLFGCIGLLVYFKWIKA
ncbi:MAG: hypothetical protein ACJ75B_16365 [Flavisolibacter sp.]